MFTPDDRERIRESILARARSDPRITGGAITGSASIGSEDRWSDIDLAFGLKDAGDMQPALGDYTRFMYDQHTAVDHLDVPSNAWIYRVFLLRNTLQVDIAFTPAATFGARGPTWRQVFGESEKLSFVEPPKAEWLVGMAWLYGLHVRSCIKRGKYWQAEYMIHTMRDHVLHLACLRLGLPAREGRGFDTLPAGIRAPLEDAFVARLDAPSLESAFRATIEGLIREAHGANAEQARRIEAVVRELVSS